MNRSLAIGVLCLASTGIVRDSLAIDYTRNYIPNGSFEKGSSVEGPYQCKINDNPESPATESWSGGIVTVGSGATFCNPAVLDGMYALALHIQYPEAKAFFSLPRDGLYELSYLLTCRNIYPYPYDQTLHVYFDDETVPASVRTPPSYLYWIAVTNRGFRLSAGRHCIRLVGVTSERALGYDPSVVVDNLRLTYEREPDMLKNGSFEQYDGVAPSDYVVNGESGFQSLHWVGGIVTRGFKEFCSPSVADGLFAMALHYAYPVISNRVDVIEGGTYELSFRTVSRRAPGVESCQQTVSVYFDDETKPLCSVLPTSTSSWDSWSFSRRLTKGEHVIRFVGVTPSKADGTPVDSSTVIDDVHLTLKKRSGGLVFALY